MEGILERHVAKNSQEQRLEWKAQATAQYIKDKWGLKHLLISLREDLMLQFIPEKNIRFG